MSLIPDWKEQTRAKVDKQVESETARKEGMRITITTIPHNEQRYNTCGDWQWDESGTRLTIFVSELPTQGWVGAFLIGVHELVEAGLCRARGITTDMVDSFDLAYDPKSDIEPGDHPSCPCRKEHCTATGIERILAAEFSVAWTPYEEELTKLTESYPEEGK